MRLRRRIKAVVGAAIAAVVSVMCLYPFLAGHHLNKYWATARLLVYVTMACFLWFFMACMFLQS